MVNTRMKRYGSQTNTKNWTPEKGKYVTCESENKTRKQATPLQAPSDGSSVDGNSATLVTTSVVAAQEQQFPTETLSLSAAESAGEKLMNPAVTQRNNDENMEPETELGKKQRKVDNMHLGMEQDDESEKEMNIADNETLDEIQEVGIENDTVTRRLSPDLSDSKDKQDIDNCDKIQSTSVTLFSDPEVITLDEDDGIEVIEESNEAFTTDSNIRNESESGVPDELSIETDNGIKRVEDGYHQSQTQEAEAEERSQTVPGDSNSESSDDVVIINSTNISSEKKSDEESSGKVLEFGNIHSPRSKTDASKTKLSVNVEAEKEKLFKSTLKSLETGGIIKQSVTASVTQKGQQKNKKPIVLEGAEVMRNIPRGMTKSGRVWKSPCTKFSKNINSKGLKESFEKKQKLSAELKRVKEHSRALKAEIQKQKERNRERIAKVRKMREENAKKAEIVQVITNTAKLRRMTKKQLRNIEKRDTTTVCKI